MELRLLLVIASAIVLHANALVPFWKPCPRPDPEWDGCVFEAASGAYPFLVAGDPKYNIPAMDPLREDKFVIQRGSNYFGIVVDINNATITGLRDARLTAAKINLEQRRMVFDIYIPKLNFTSDYYFSGKILGSFINRTGDDNITMNELNGRMIAQYDKFKEVARDGIEHEYYNITDVDVKLNITKVDMRFNNLFNGNHYLESRANTFLSRNWRELFNFLGSSMNRALGDSFNRMMNSAYQDLAVDEMFPYKDGATELKTLHVPSTKEKPVEPTPSSEKTAEIETFTTGDPVTDYILTTNTEAVQSSTENIPTTNSPDIIVYIDNSGEEEEEEEEEEQSSESTTTNVTATEYIS